MNLISLTFIFEDEACVAEENDSFNTVSVELSCLGKDGVLFIEDVIFQDPRSIAENNDATLTLDIGKSESSYHSHKHDRAGGNGKVASFKALGDEFIEDFDSFLDGVEEDIRAEENNALESKKDLNERVAKLIDSSKTNNSLVTDKQEHACGEVAGVTASEDSIQFISDVKSLLSSSDQDVSDIEHDGLSEKDKGDNEDSWDALDDIKLPHCRFGTWDSFVNNHVSTSSKDMIGTLALKQEYSKDDSLTSVSELPSEELSVCDDQVEVTDNEAANDENDSLYSMGAFGKCCGILQGSLAAVVNIAEYLLQKELSSLPLSQKCSSHDSLTSVSGLPSEKLLVCDDQVEVTGNEATKDENNVRYSMGAFGESCGILQCSSAAVVNIAEYLLQRELSSLPLAQKCSSHDSLTSVSEVLSDELSFCDDHVNDTDNEFIEDENNGLSPVGALEGCCGIRQNSQSTVVNVTEHLLQKDKSVAFEATVGLNNTSPSSVNKEGYKSDEFSLSSAKFQVLIEQMKEKNDALQEIVDFTNRENDKLLDQVIAVKNEAKRTQKEKENLKTELENMKREIERQKSAEEYKERELKNLRGDIETKEEKLKGLEDDLDYTQMDNNDLSYEIDSLQDKLKESEESNECLKGECYQLEQMIKELKTVISWEASGHDYGYLREEVELLKGSLDLSRHQEELLKHQVHELKDLRTFRYRNDELEGSYKEPDTNEEDPLDQMKYEFEEIIKQLKEKLATVEREKVRMSAELHAAKLNVSFGETQLCAMKEEKELIVEQLQDQLVSLRKENCNMITELSRMSDKDTEVRELQKQIKDLIKENAHLQHKSLVGKMEQTADTENVLSESSSVDNKILEGKQKKYKNQIKKLKKRIRKNEREIEQVGRFAWQGGRDDRDSKVWLTLLKEERKELAYARNWLRVQTERLQKKETELDFTKMCLQQKEEEMDQAQEGLRLMEETAESLKRVVSQMDTILQYADSHTVNSDISSIVDDCDRDDSNDSLNTDIFLLNEDEHSETGDEEDRSEMRSFLIVGREDKTMKYVENDEELDEDSEHTEMNSDDICRRPMKLQVDQLNQTLKNSLGNAELLKESLQLREERWEEKTSDRDYEIDDLKTQVRIRDSEIESLNGCVAQLENESIAYIEMLKKEVENTKNLLREKEAVLVRAEHIARESLENPGIRDHCQFDERVDFVGKPDAIVKKLQENLESAQRQLLQKEATLKETEAFLTTLLASSHSRDFNEFLYKIQSIPEAIDNEKADKTSGLATAEAENNGTVEHLKEKLQITETTLSETIRALERAQAEQAIKASLLEAAEATHSGIVSQLEEKLEETQNRLKEKEDALETVQAKMASLPASSDGDHDEFVEQLQEKLDSTQRSLKERIVALQQVEEDLQIKTSHLGKAESNHTVQVDQFENTIKELKRDLKRMESSLREKTDSLEQAETQIQLNASLLASAQAENNDLMVKLVTRDGELQGDLERTKNLLKEKEDKLMHVKEELEVKARLAASAENKLEGIVSQLECELKSSKISFEETKASLRQSEQKLKRSESVLVSTDAKLCIREKEIMKLKSDRTNLESSIKRLEGELEETKSRLKQRKQALETTDMELQKHKDIVRQLGSELKISKNSLKETEAALGQSEDKLKLKESVLASTETKLCLREKEILELKSDRTKLESSIKHVKEELEETKTCLKEKKQVLETTDMELHLKKSLLADEERKRNNVVTQLEDDLKAVQNTLKNTETNLENTELDLISKSSLVSSLEAKVCLRENELEELKLSHKGRDLELERVSASMEDLKKLMEISDTLIADKNKEIVSLRTCLTQRTREIQKMKFNEEPTQDKLQLVSAELSQAHNEKAKLRREVTAAATRLEDQKIAADKERNVQQEQINSALEDVKGKTKIIQDLNVKIKESSIQVSKLECDKREMEQYSRQYKERTTNEMKWLKQALKASRENNTLYEKRIASKRQENAELKREIQRLNNKLLKKDAVDMTKDAAVEVSSRPLMVSS